jgi:hypothetical protein
MLLYRANGTRLDGVITIQEIQSASRNTMTSSWPRWTLLFLPVGTAGAVGEPCAELSYRLLNRLATMLIAMATTAVPNTQDSRACRSAIRRIGLAASVASETW